MNQVAQSPEQQLKTAKILWMAMLASTFFYLFVGMIQLHGAEQAAERSPLANMVWLFAVVFAGLGFLLPNMLFKGQKLENAGFQASIVRWAMFESVAILALVNVLAHGVTLVEFIIGVGASFVLILLHPPKRTI